MKDGTSSVDVSTAEPSGYKWLWRGAILLSSIGVINFAVLSYTHYRVNVDPSYASFCAISKSVNCDTVAHSPYSVTAGLPVSVWGIAGILLFLSLLAHCNRLNEFSRNAWSLLFLLAGAFTIVSLYFAYLSTFFIKSFCPLCLVAYSVNFGLLYISWIARRRLSLHSLAPDITALWRHGKDHLTAFMVPALAASVLLLPILGLVPKYWEAPSIPKGIGVHRGVTDEGDPWIGSDNPVLDIIEYGDYQCVQCRKMHFHLRRLIENNPGKLRLIHRHFPMDHKVNPLVSEPYHVGSGALALLAVYASSMNKFWELNDLLYEIAAANQTVDIRSIASRAGLDRRGLFDEITTPDHVQKLERNIKSGLKLGINGTPAFFVNGQLFHGTIPAETIERYLN
ncbi:MAG: thioredoxin domain-containing protein [Methylotetracoccus sp.]|nr:thioredoxin domain-containing protein [Methylotetracoccus sp.]